MPVSSTPVVSNLRFFKVLQAYLTYRNGQPSQASVQLECGGVPILDFTPNECQSENVGRQFYYAMRQALSRSYPVVQSLQLVDRRLVPDGDRVGLRLESKDQSGHSWVSVTPCGLDHLIEDAARAAASHFDNYLANGRRLPARRAPRGVALREPVA